MPKLDILVYPDRRLRQVAQPVPVFNEQLKQLVADMAETMYSANGIGLAAVQVNVPQRVVVMDLSAEKNSLQVFINPQISECEGSIEVEEGCLSLPGVTAAVERAETLNLTAQDVNGRAFAMRAEEMLCICIQHEIDHLNGKVFVDYLSRLKQSRIRKKLSKESLIATPAAA